MSLPDALGDRMKTYEARETDRRLMPGLPVYARLDGKTFSSFTRGMDRPYDVRMSDTMIELTKQLVQEFGATVGYTQSDEISLGWNVAARTSQMVFDGKIQKLVSVMAGTASVRFGLMALQYWPEKVRKSPPVFDCRLFEMPNLTEAANAFLWRELDATKNAITMAARCYYSDKDLFAVNGADKQELLFQKGVNFNNYPTSFKRGTYVAKRKVRAKLTPEILAKIPEDRRDPDAEYERNIIQVLDLPPASRIANLPDVLFSGADLQMRALMA